jgi:DNA repair exonuclease SbcCD ATPase subunit
MSIRLINPVRLGLGLCLAAALLTGCSSKIAYNNVDWLAVRWVDRQIDLDRDQRQLVSRHVSEQQQWHCATQLQAYEDWLEQMRLDLLSDRIDRDQLIRYGDEMAEFARNLASRMAPMLVDLAASLDDQQVESALAELDDRIEKLREEIETRSPEQWATDRVEGMERRLKRLMGSLNDNQKQRLENWAKALRPTHDYQLVQRIYWRGRIEQALNHRDEHQYLAAEIDALLDPAAVWPDAYRQAMEDNRTLTLDALVDLVKLVEPRQRDRISARLARLKNDVQRLSCDGEAPQELIAATSSIGRVGATR